MIIRCSRCGREIDNLIIKISTKYEILKNTDQGLISEYNNISEPTSEILCEKCFNMYCDCIDALNTTVENPLSDYTTIVDDVQYGD